MRPVVVGAPPDGVLHNPWDGARRERPVLQGLRCLLRRAPETEDFGTVLRCRRRPLSSGRRDSTYRRAPRASARVSAKAPRLLPALRWAVDLWANGRRSPERPRQYRRAARSSYGRRGCRRRGWVGVSLAPGGGGRW